MLHNRFFIAGIVCLMAALDCFAQNAPANNTNFVYSSPSGNYIMLNVDGKSVSAINPKGYSVERSAKSDNKFTKLGDFAPVQSYEAFQQLVGTELAANLKNYIKAKTDADVVRFFNTTHASKEYGFFIFDINFLRAMGLVYLDAVAPDKTGDYEYKLKTASGSTLRQQVPLAFNKSSLPRGLVKKIFTTDSLVSIRWEFPAYQSSLPVFARVYKQEGGAGRFVPLPVKTTLNATERNAYAVYEQKTVPEQLVNYYVVPVDIIGNEGLPSDTATAISIDYKKIPGLRDITVKDSLGGLLSQWKPLPRKPYYTGIQVLRSRDARKDFIVLDSVAVTASSYLDKQVLPNVSYFYKFRVIVYKLSGYDEIIATTVHGTKNSANNPPLAPKNLAAFKDGKNIKLTWNPNTELDLFAYYVLRGTSDKNMEIVSPAIMDTTWTDSSATLSGRTNYVYSVLCMNNNQLKSEPSVATGISPARGGFIEAPAGMTIRASGGKLLLSWTDVSKKDVAVAGYILYKRKATEQNFSPVGDALITRAYYEDAAIETNTGYVYAVSAVDRFGYESSRSPDAPFSLHETIQPPAQVFVRKLSGGVEISWPHNTDADIAGYNIYRKTTKTGYIKLGTAKPGELIFSDKKFIPNELNIYAISISTKNGESGKSVEKSLFVGNQ